MSEKNNPALAAAVPQDENQIIAERRAKLAALRALGHAYPNDFRRDALAGELHGKFDGKSNEELDVTTTKGMRLPHGAMIAVGAFAFVVMIQYGLTV